MARLDVNCFDEGWSEASFEDFLESSAHLALGWFEQGHLRGYAFAQMGPDDADILRIASDPLSRRAGIGRELVSELIRQATESGISRLTLDVREDNMTARSFYTALGFSKDGTRPKYYRLSDGNRLDAVLLSLYIRADNDNPRVDK